MNTSTKNTILWIEDQLRRSKPVHWMDRLNSIARLFVYIASVALFILSMLIAFMASHMFVWMVENQ